MLDMDLDEVQMLVHGEALRRWPTMTVESEGLALAEESGEVCRAILKRREGTRGTPSEWTTQLAVEIGQAMLVLLNIAAMEGLPASEVLRAAWVRFEEKPDTEPMNVGMAPGCCEVCGAKKFKLAGGFECLSDHK